MIPGFVDSHTHLVFAGDRSEEFAARMAGAPYEAGGIRVTTEATRAASEDELLALARARRAEGLAAGITEVEVKSGLRARGRVRGAPLPRRRRAHRRGHLPRRPPAAARVRGPRRRVRRARLRADARRLPAVRPLDRRLLRARRLRRSTSRGRCCVAGRDAGLGLRVHGNQLGPGPGARLAVELGAASVDHCTYLDRRRHRGARGERDRGHVPPGDRLLDPPALSRRAARDRRRGRRRDRDQLRTPARATRPRCRSASRSRCATCG